jgi:VWFA-related protein
MKKGIAVLFGIMLLILPTWFVLAQDGSATALEITGVNPSDAPTITITANVLDNNSRPVVGLTQADFTLTGSLSEIAQIVRVENITADDLPFATVLVIDVSSSMSGLPIQQAQVAARQFVESVGVNDPVAIVTFGNDAQLVQDYTTDKTLLLQTIDNLFIGGRTALYDGAVLGIEVAANSPIPRRAVILLSDGAEFGGMSSNQRNAAIERATEAGVGVYTIGLGFGIDRTYLQELAAGTNTRNYESPAPEELAEIYGELASLFRSQYVITLEAPDMPLDGTEYDFTLQASNSNEASSVLRAPIPVPLVELPDSLFEAPILEVTTVTPDVRADDELASVEILLDGTTITPDANGSFIIDPSTFEPGEYDLAVRAIDVDGDSGADEGVLTIGATATTVAFNELFGEEPITEPQTVTLTTSGQTPVVNAVYGVLGDTVTDIAPATIDAVNNFPYILDPIKYAPGTYTLRADVTNEGGVTSTATQPITIGTVPPRDIRITGIQADAPISVPVTIAVETTTQPGTEVTDVEITLNGEDISGDLVINPSLLPPGENELLITVTDSSGNTTTASIPVSIGALPPTVNLTDVPDIVSAFQEATADFDSQSPLEEVTYSFDDSAPIDLIPSADGVYPPIPIDPEELGDGEHTLTITATNASGETVTQTETFTVANPTPTFTPSPTVDVTGTAVAQSTNDVQATSDALAQSTVAAQSTSAAQEQATTAAEATTNARSTTNAQVETAQAEVNRQETVEANATNVANTFLTREAGGTATSAVQEATDTQATTESELLVALATNDAQATLDTQATGDAQATADAEGTVNAQATTDVRATVEAEGTVNAQSTADAQATVEAEGTVNAQSTGDAQGTQSASAATEVTPEPTIEATIAATDEPTATVTAADEPTAGASPTYTTAPTLTPMGEIVEVDAQDAPPAIGTNLLLLGCGVLALILVLFFILRRGRRSDT